MRTFAAFALVLSVVSVRAFVDIRVPQPDDSAVVEAAPQQQVHVIFSSHLVRHMSTATKPCCCVVPVTSGSCGQGRPAATL